MKKVFLFLIVALAAALLIGPFLVPVRPLPSLPPPSALADADSRFLTLPFAGTDGIEIHLKTAGEGEPTFVLLHGFAANLTTWDRVAGDFAARGRVIRYDRIPFGLSQRLTPGDWRGDNPYTPHAVRDRLLALLDALDVERVVLVGNSAGGALAVGMALEHPEQIAGLILVSPAIYTSGGTPSTLRPLLNSPQLDHLGPLIARRFPDLGLEDQAYHNPAAISDEERAAAAVSFQVAAWDEALWAFTAASRQVDYVGRLGEVRVPTLVISGDDDRIVPTAESVRLAGALPGAMLDVLPNCGHVAHLECDRAFMTAVDAFLLSIP